MQNKDKAPRLERRKYVNRSNRVQRKIYEETPKSHLRDWKQLPEAFSELKIIEEFAVFCQQQKAKFLPLRRRPAKNMI